MNTTKSYNGYKNRSQWNQSLWINNDKGLYRLALEAIQYTANRDEAVDYVYSHFVDGENFTTPDGHKWSKAGIRAAMVGM